MMETVALVPLFETVRAQACALERLVASQVTAAAAAPPAVCWCGAWVWPLWGGEACESGSRSPPLGRTAADEIPAMRADAGVFVMPAVAAQAAPSLGGGLAPRVEDEWHVASGRRAARRSPSPSACCAAASRNRFAPLASADVECGYDGGCGSGSASVVDLDVSTVADGGITDAVDGGFAGAGGALGRDLTDGVSSAVAVLEAVTAEAAVLALPHLCELDAAGDDQSAAGHAFPEQQLSEGLGGPFEAMARLGSPAARQSPGATTFGVVASGTDHAAGKDGFSTSGRGCALAFDEVIAGEFDAAAEGGHVAPREVAADAHRDEASVGSECSFFADAREKVRNFLRQGRERDRVDAAAKRLRMRRRRRRSRSRARATAAARRDVLGPSNVVPTSNVDWADCGDDDDDEDGSEDRQAGEGEKVERFADLLFLPGASHSVAVDAVRADVAIALGSTLGRELDFEVEQTEIDGEPSGFFEVLVSVPHGYRIAREQYDAAERAVRGVLAFAAIDVERVTVFPVSW